MKRTGICRNRVYIMAFLLLCPLSGLAADPDAKIDEPQFIYRCFPGEDGHLQGGRLLADPLNPHHVPLPLAEGAPEGTWAFETIHESGPGSNRLDIAIVGDGYTAGELGQYAIDAQDVFDAFFGGSGEQPFRAYRDFFNVHRVDVISPESGVDEPDLDIFIDTELDMYYNCGGTPRLLCLNVTKTRNAADSAPDWDQILALANSDRYGGAGYASQNIGTLAGQNSAALEIALHEFGHSFGDLADEYEYDGPTVYSGGEPSAQNLSIMEEPEMLAAEAKWWRWLDAAGVSTFEGGGYSEQGIYRPTNNSLMRNLSRPFQQVNEEQLVIKIWREVDPIEDATPPFPADGTDYDQDTVFFVDTVDPIPNTLSYTWMVDGFIAEEITGPTFSLNQLDLEIGLHAVRVDVVDATTRVRNETARAQWMSDFREWEAVYDCARPVINEQPQSDTVCEGETITLSVAATGDGVMYQWQHNGIDISGATSSELNIPDADPGDAGSYSVTVYNDCGPRQSDDAMVFLQFGASFTTQPTGQTICAGATASFFASASGTGTLNYQWLKNDQPIPGAVSFFHIISSAQSSDSGIYSVEITNVCGTTASHDAPLSVNESPMIDTQPASTEVCDGAALMLTVDATGGGLTYQWYLDDVAISGAVSATYSVPLFDPFMDAGNYDVDVSNNCGTAVSDVAVVSEAAMGCDIALGDFDEDGDVDLVDFGAFQLCFNGGEGVLAPGCETGDFDGDNDVDLVDFGGFQLVFTGS